MKNLHRQRGQTLPVWAFGTLTVLVLLAYALSYGNMLRWQIRAQNAADAAARGVLSIQATQWNEMESTLHAAGIEEYRIRSIMQAMLYTIQGGGGCDPTPSATAPNSCNAMYENLRQQYIDSVSRYTSDVLILNRIANPTFSDQEAAVRTALQEYETNCGQPNGAADCAFHYNLVAIQPRVDNYLEDVLADCCNLVVGGGTSVNPKLSQNFSPMEIEVVACANTPSIMGSLLPGAGTYMAIGRAAATTIMATQEFMNVGTMVNPSTGNPFQLTEYPESTNDSPVLSDGDEWYDVDYGGNGSTSNGSNGYFENVNNPGLQTFLGWWSSIPIAPFAGTIQPGVNFACK